MKIISLLVFGLGASGFRLGGHHPIHSNVSSNVI